MDQYQQAKAKDRAREARMTTRTYTETCATCQRPAIVLASDPTVWLCYWHVLIAGVPTR